VQNAAHNRECAAFFVVRTAGKLYFSGHDKKAHGVALACAALKWGKNVVEVHYLTP
jgi:hypothetical protein